MNDEYTKEQEPSLEDLAIQAAGYLEALNLVESRHLAFALRRRVESVRASAPQGDAPDYKRIATEIGRYVVLGGLSEAATRDLAAELERLLPAPVTAPVSTGPQVRKLLDRFLWDKYGCTIEHHRMKVLKHFVEWIGEQPAATSATPVDGERTCAGCHRMCDVGLLLCPTCVDEGRATPPPSTGYSEGFDDAARVSRVLNNVAVTEAGEREQHIAKLVNEISVNAPDVLEIKARAYSVPERDAKTYMFDVRQLLRIHETCCAELHDALALIRTLEQRLRFERLTSKGAIDYTIELEQQLESVTPSTSAAIRAAAEEIAREFQLEKPGWVTLGRIKIDPETETETFERTSETATDRVWAILSRYFGKGETEQENKNA